MKSIFSTPVEMIKKIGRPLITLVVYIIEKLTVKYYLWTDSHTLTYVSVHNYYTSPPTLDFHMVFILPGHCFIKSYT